MNQTAMPTGQKELKLQKTTIVKLNMMKVNQMMQAGVTTQQPLTTASTAPQCDITTTSVTGII